MTMRLLPDLAPWGGALVPGLAIDLGPDGRICQFGPATDPPAAPSTAMRLGRLAVVPGRCAWVAAARHAQRRALPDHPDADTLSALLAYGAALEAGATDLVDAAAPPHALDAASALGVSLRSAAPPAGEDPFALGTPANLVTLDLESLSAHPHGSLLSRFGAGEAALAVRDVVVAGRFVVRERILLTVSARSLARRLRGLFQAAPLPDGEVVDSGG